MPRELAVRGRLVYRRAPLITLTAGDKPINKGLNLQAYGVSYANYSVQWVKLPGGRFIPPSSRGTFAMDGAEEAIAEWAAPDGTNQPSQVAAQFCVLLYTEEPLSDTGGTQAVVTNTNWIDGTAALPGFPNATQGDMGLFRPANNRFGFSVAGVEQFELTSTGAKWIDGTVANPGLAALSEPTSGFYRIGAGILGASILGVERQRISATLNQVAGILQPEADGTRDFGTSALRWQDGYFSSSLRIGTIVSSTGIVRGPNSGGLLGWRNAANTNDITFGPVAGVNDLSYIVSGSEWVRLIQNAAVAIGANPSVLGALRMPNAVANRISFRNVGNTGEGGFVYLSNVDVMRMADNGTDRPMNTSVSDGLGHMTATTRYWQAQ